MNNYQSEYYLRTFCVLDLDPGIAIVITVSRKGSDRVQMRNSPITVLYSFLEASLSLA